MVKPTTKWGKGITTLIPKKSSQNKVDASTGKTKPTRQGVAISKKSPTTHSRSLSTHSNVQTSIKTHSSSLKVMAATSKVGVHTGAGEAPATSQTSHSRKVSKSKVVGHKSLGSTPRFPPSITKNMGVDKMDKQ